MVQHNQKIIITTAEAHNSTSSNINFSFSSTVTDLFFSASNTISDTTLHSLITSTFSGHLKGTLLLATSPNQLGLVLGMAIDVEDGLLYYSDRQSAALHRIVLSNAGEGGSEFVMNDVSAWGMTYDWINGSLYWTDDT